MTDIPVHPVQRHNAVRHAQAVMPQVVTLRAYEVYKAVHGEQKAMIDGHCRGGFGLGELIAFLYARSFPASEWRQRCDEAFKGMDIS